MKTKQIITAAISLLVFGVLGTFMIYRSKKPKAQPLLGVVSPRKENK